MSIVELREALRTTGAVRRFRSDPVPDETLYRILDTARFAPNGGNRQGWRVVVLRDPVVRRGVRDLYLPGWYEYLAMRAAGLTPWAPVTDADAERRALGAVAEMATAGAARPGFAEELDQVPVLLAVLADLRRLAAVDRDNPGYAMVGGASIYPFVWSVLLAARDEGLGGVMTTMVVRRQDAIRALVHAPAELVVVALVALGSPEVPPPTRLRRDRVEAFTTVDTCDGAIFTIDTGENPRDLEPAGRGTGR
ncbi:MAG: nitroreductase family protein [Actinomycetota bacterium]|nr:nitroreductase family protein [Actinomycetota bacterium]